MRRMSWGRGVSLVLSAALVAGLVPAPALAEMLPDEPPAAQEQSELLSEEDWGGVASPDEAAADENAQADAAAQEPADEQAAPEADESAAATTAAPADDDLQLAAQSATVEPVELSLNSAVDATADEGSYWVGSFTAPADGRYSFYSSGTDDADYIDTYGELYGSLEDLELEDEEAREAARLSYDDEPADNGNFLISYEFYEGETVYLKVRDYSDEAFSCMVMVTDATRLGRLPWSFTDVYPYTGEPVDVREITFYDDYNDVDYELVKGTDYRFVEYLDDEGNPVDAPTDLGNYQAVFEAIDGSGYFGSATVGFTIVPANNLSLATIDLHSYSCAYTGEPVVLDLTVTMPDGTLLTEGTDYELRFFAIDENDNWDPDAPLEGAPSDMGEYYVGIVEAENSAYQGKGYSCYRFTIYDANDLAEADVYLDGYDYDEWDEELERYVYVYLLRDGVAEPRMNVELDGETLTEGVDYQLAYDNNTEATGEGEWATVTVEGISPYHGTITRMFKIVDHLSLAGEDTWADLSYDRSGFTSENIDTDGNGDGDYQVIHLSEFIEDAQGLFWGIYAAGSSLVEGLDYCVSVVKETINSWWVTFTGTGDYGDSYTVKVDGAEDAADLFTRRTSAQMSYNRAYVAFGADGKPQVVSGMNIAGMTRGIDYELGDTVYVERDGEKVPITSAADLTDEEKESYSLVKVEVKGLGAYDGCANTVDVSLLDGTGIDLSSTGYDSPRMAVRLEGSTRVYDYERNAWTYYLTQALANDPTVTVGVYAQRYVELNEGEGFAVTKSISGGTGTITLSPDGKSPLFSNTRAIDVKIVDSYDLSQMASYAWLSGVNEQYVEWDLGDGELSQKTIYSAGFDYVPYVNLSSDATFDVRFRDEAGVETDVIKANAAGAYTVVITGTGNWTGTLELPLMVRNSTLQGKTSLEGYNCNIHIGTATTANPEPSVSISECGHSFVEGRDYTLQYGKTTSGTRGWVKITATSDGDLYGIAKEQFVIEPTAAAGTDLSDGYELLAQLPTDGYALPSQLVRPYAPGSKPAVLVRDAYTHQEVAASDYEVSYGNNDAFGLAWVKVTGKGSYSGSLSADYLIMGDEADTRESIAGATVTAAPQTYTGEALTPAVSVKLGKTTLREGRDYTVEAGSYVDAGIYTVRVTGMGTYKDSATGSFEVKKAAQTLTADASSVTYGALQEIEVGGTVVGELSASSDSEAVASIDSVDQAQAKVIYLGKSAGTATITITATETDNYLAASKAVKVTVNPRVLTTDVASVGAPEQTYAFGAELTPEPTAAWRGETPLELGKDFEVVSYANNVNAGDATVTIKGIGNYSGTAEGRFVINPYELAELGAPIDDQTYTGEELKPISVVANGTVLVEGTDYTVTYQDNVNAGVGKATVTGKGNFAGSINVSFEIAKAPQAITATDRSVAMGGTSNLGASAPAGLLSYEVADPSIATVAEDGTVSGLAVGQTLVTISAAGSDNYLAAENATVMLTVSESDLSDKAEVTLAETTYTYDGTAKEPEVTVMLDGAPLKAEDDYTVTYANNTDAGTAKVTVSGSGSFTGAIEKTFTINKAQQVITASNKDVLVKKTVKLGATALGGAKLTYKSSNTKIATVNGSGVVKAAKKAKAGKKVTITITAPATKNYTAATKKVTVRVKAKNTLTAKAKKKTVNVSLKKVTKGNVTLSSNIKVSKAKGGVSYANVSSNATAKTFQLKGAKVIVPKGTKKGTYTVKIRVTAKGNGSYVAGTKNVSYKIKVK